MDLLSDDILSLIVAIEPQLGLACRRFWAILERQSRATALRMLGNQTLLNKFKLKVTQLFGFTTWGVVAYLSQLDMWFFNPQHIVDLQDADITDAESADDTTDLALGIWRHVDGMRWGQSIHASNVRWLHLRYQTKLRPGRYKILINVRVANFVKLYPVKFQALSANVTQLGSIYPTVHLDTNNNHPDCMEEYNQYLQFQPCELCIGLLDVHGDPTQESWPHITFEISDMSENLNRGIMFNYLFFQRVDETTPPKDFWALEKKSFWPTPEWAQLYNDFAAQKFLYC